MNGFNEWQPVLMAPWGPVGGALALLTALTVFALAVRALRGDAPLRRLTLLSLRALGLLCALVLFFQPGVQLRNVTRVPNHVAVLVDTSESMNLSERAGVKPRAARAAALLRREAAALSALRKDHKIDFYTFGERLLPSTEEALLQHKGAPSHADATRMREALAALRQRYEGRDLAGVLLLSDGQDNGRLGEGAEQKAEVLDGDTRDFLRALDAPVHTVLLGQPGVQDLAVSRVLADEFAFARTALQVEARLKVSGGDAAGWTGTRLPVTLRRDGQPVLTVDVELQEGQAEYKVLFPFTPERVGKYLYEISVPELPGEAIKENNRRLFVLKVIRDKIRVVHVAGRPSYDVRFLRGLLKRDPNIDLVSFFILRSPSDMDMATSETSLIPFPCEELFQQQLRSFDLIVLHNFNYNAYCAQYLQPSIVPFVQEGGAVAMLGGDLAFSSGGYYDSDVARVLPVEMYPAGDSFGGDFLGGAFGPRAKEGSDRLVSYGAFRPRLTAEGRSHVVTALRLEVRENEGRWQTLPQLEGMNLVARARPGASVLLAHPTLRDADGKPMALLAVQEVGKGRSLALGTDSTWRWGFGELEGEDGRAVTYQRFFGQAIRWLVRDPSLRLLRVETTESEYGRDQQVRIDVKALGPDYRPAQKAEVSLQVTRIGAEGALGSRTVRTNEEGEARVELDPQRPGGYRITARATLGGRPTEESEVFLVRGAVKELVSPEAEPRLLAALSKATGGEFRREDADLSGLTFHASHIAKINSSKDVELWDHLGVFLLATLSLCLNWYLRRRWGYA